MDESEIVIENGLVNVTKFQTNDPQVVAALQAAESDGRDVGEYFESALVIGVKALLATGVSIGIEALTDEVSRTKTEMRDATELLATSVTNQIKEVSGESGLIATNVKALLQDFEAKITDLAGGEKSPLVDAIKLQVTEMAKALFQNINTISENQSSRIARLLNPSDPESPLRILTMGLDSLAAEVRLIGEEKSKSSAVSDALENTAKSGLPYEDAVIAVLKKVSGIAGDRCIATGQQEGFVKRSFKGDGVVEIRQGDRLIGRIVAEAKNQKLALTTTSKTVDSWMKEIEASKENRGAIAFLGLCKNESDMPNGHRILALDRLTWILAYDPEIDNPEILFLVYQMLKTNTQVAAGDLSNDVVAELNLLVDEAIAQVLTISELAKKTHTMSRLAGEVDKDIRKLKSGLLERLESIKAIMQPDLERQEIVQINSLEIEN